MENWITNVNLVGTHIKLKALQADHQNDLLKAAEDGELWDLWYTNIPGPDTIQEYVTDALKSKENGTSYPFVVTDKQGKVIGTTRYLNLDPINNRLEIGATWYALSVQKTLVNTECKYQLLKYAFESLNVIAVEFRTHWHNHASRNAILRLGAKQDGVLRNHTIDHLGRIRDSVVYSILNSEWLAVKQSLEFKLSKKR
ncbi:MAG: GNAT family N-acetyltransferase [Saprospiraceae bacterium]|nr:GNAT family N-acetyltransferase [Bacteroidia bacterium]NNE16736.1 GNAT family N-acetyltransferase [Saprospiraceae bacterium]NNL92637.1 GNAT family N-acetyltransferase [Saprospiraceae bacterium]